MTYVLPRSGPLFGRNGVPHSQPDNPTHVKLTTAIIDYWSSFLHFGREPVPAHVAATGVK